MATLAKSIAIVSGGATGIGAACAEMLARDGFSVAINYRQSLVSAEQTVARCRQTGAQAIAVQGDVANDDDCRKIVERTVDEWGAVDVLVNNAGVTLFADASDRTRVEP